MSKSTPIQIKLYTSYSRKTINLPKVLRISAIAGRIRNNQKHNPSFRERIDGMSGIRAIQKDSALWVLSSVCSGIDQLLNFWAKISLTNLILVLDAVGIALKLVVPREAAVKGGDFIFLRSGRLSICIHCEPPSRQSSSGTLYSHTPAKKSRYISDLRCVFSQSCHFVQNQPPHLFGGRLSGVFARGVFDDVDSVVPLSSGNSERSCLLFHVYPFLPGRAGQNL